MSHWVLWICFVCHLAVESNLRWWHYFERSLASATKLIRLQIWSKMLLNLGLPLITKIRLVVVNNPFSLSRSTRVCKQSLRRSSFPREQVAQSNCYTCACYTVYCYCVTHVCVGRWMRGLRPLSPWAIFEPLQNMQDQKKHKNTLRPSQSSCCHCVIVHGDQPLLNKTLLRDFS